MAGIRFPANVQASALQLGYVLAPQQLGSFYGTSAFASLLEGHGVGVTDHSFVCIVLS